MTTPNTATSVTATPNTAPRSAPLHLPDAIITALQSHFFNTMDASFPDSQKAREHRQATEAWNLVAKPEPLHTCPDCKKGLPQQRIHWSGKVWENVCASCRIRTPLPFSESTAEPEDLNERR